MRTAPLALLSECCEIVSGATPSTSEPSYWGGDIHWATPKDLSDLEGTYLDSTPRTLTSAGLANCSANVLPPRSVLFSSRAPIGLVAINRVPVATNQGFKSFVPDPSRVHAEYLFHWLRTNRPMLESLGNGATFKEVSKAVVSRVRLPLPPLPAQRRIAEVLDRAETLRTQRRQALAQLDALAAAIFLDMFGEIENNTHGLPVKTLDELNDADRPICYGILMPGPDQVGGVPYVRVVDMKNGEIDVRGVRCTSAEISHQYRRSKLRAGDLLISIRGHVGRMATVPAELDSANITQDSARIAPKGVDPTYLLAALRSGASQRWMQRRTRGVAVQGLNIGDLRMLPVMLPPHELQQRFSRSVDSINEMRRFARTQATQMDALFASLQHRVFRGEL